MQIDARAWEALEFRTACTLDGGSVRISTVRRNGFVVPYFPDHLTRGESDEVDGDERQELQDVLCYGLNNVQRHTWLRIMDDWTVHEIAKDEGVTHPAIYCRLRGKDGTGGMVAKNRFVWFWWQLRLRGRVQ